MLEAVIADILKIRGCRVSTSLSRDREPPNLPRAGRLAVEICDSPESELATFDRLASSANVSCIIAPESHGLLADRCRRVETAGRSLAGPSVSAVERCADKLRLARLLSERGIPTPETRLLDWNDPPPPVLFPAVVKPRFGAGSNGCRLVASPAEWKTAFRHRQPQDECGELIVQPFQPGDAVSVAAIVSRDGNVKDLFPPGRQILAEDGSFAYHGGEIPVAGGLGGWGRSATKPAEAVNPGGSRWSTPATLRRTEIDGLVRRVCRMIDGLRGYVGFDLIVPQDSHRPVQLVEINPRLTTSYIGYRQLTADNLAERFLLPDIERPPIVWQTAPLRFFPDGRWIGNQT